MDRGLGATFDREFGGLNEMGMSRNNFGDSFDRGMSKSTVTLFIVIDCSFSEVQTM